MALMIYNTLTRKKEEFKPIEPGKVRMYVCGMTVYDYCHLGHARVLVAFDVIVRYLRARGFDVTYVRNITDIDDKILKRAAERPELYKTYTDLTDKFIHEMHVDEASLGVVRPTMEPRATEHIEQIKAMIAKLIDKDFAYVSNNGDVYYSISKFSDYGRLSGNDMSALLAGARIEVDEDKRDPRDFALWKAAKPNEEAVWNSPWGSGRPGWHIECSAMSTTCLGDTFDIHGGGPDLKFPHHECEIAQSEAATGEHYANYWMHAGAVRVDGEKMSKSLGNFFTIREVLDPKTKWLSEEVRYLIVSSHYRSEIDYSEQSLQEARNGLDRFYFCLKEFGNLSTPYLEDLWKSSVFLRFANAMDDDFNTREALAVMYEQVGLINSTKNWSFDEAQKLAAELKAMGNLLGILNSDPVHHLRRQKFDLHVSSFSHRQVLSGANLNSSAEAIDGASDVFSGDAYVEAGYAEDNYIERRIKERVEAKIAKNFSLADEIRKKLLAQGIVLEDRKDGTTDWRRE